MIKSNSRTIKREQKKALLFREISNLISDIAQEHASLSAVYVSRVDISADTGICYVFFGAHNPIMTDNAPISNSPEAQIEEQKKTAFDEALSVLKLYKASMRRVLAQKLQGRYVPEILFVYDAKKDKVDRIEAILDKVSLELSHISEQDDVDKKT